MRRRLGDLANRWTQQASNPEDPTPRCASELRETLSLSPTFSPDPNHPDYGVPNRPLNQTGEFVHVPQKSHRCAVPKLEPFGPKMVTGTAWQCPCSRVWVVEVFVPPPASLTGGHMAPGMQWRLETRRARRRRLGLHWWQKEKR